MTNQTDLLLTQFTVGDRVELHPATDRWMSGDRYGTVAAIGLRYLHVHMDSGAIIRAVPVHIKGKVTQ